MNLCAFVLWTPWAVLIVSLAWQAFLASLPLTTLCNAVLALTASLALSALHTFFDCIRFTRRFFFEPAAGYGALERSRPCLPQRNRPCPRPCVRAQMLHDCPSQLWAMPSADVDRLGRQRRRRQHKGGASKAAPEATLPEG